ncbi:KpsF/GutQ family sugar-phosphate isomerase [Roseicitreum antarcticum]|nr:KpsF/GutQ family sugar-phosphate isomerase [Roseicitreum antarcticum]
MARTYGDTVLRLEARALDALADSLSSSFDDACAVLMGTKGRVIVSGMGKSGHVARKIAATLASTGTPAHFVHPAEASHGDLGMITVDDVCLLLSNSGETRELHDLVAYTRRFAIPLIGISKNADSTLLRQSDVALVLPDAPEACAIGMAPTTSTTLSLALGDALAVAVMRLRGFGRDAFHTFHPGGKLGAQFLTVAELMHTGDGLPRVTETAGMPEVLLQMTGKGFGVAPVTDAGRLTGIITDGDLRRNLEGLMTRRACDVATRTPRSIAPGALVSEAVRRMNEAKVHALCVVDEGDMLVGLIRLHDCLRAGVV